MTKKPKDFVKLNGISYNARFFTNHSNGAKALAENGLAKTEAEGKTLLGQLTEALAMQDKAFVEAEAKKAKQK